MRNDLEVQMKLSRNGLLPLIMLIAILGILFAGGSPDTADVASEAAQETADQFQFSSYSGSDTLTARGIMENANNSLIASDIIADIIMTLENANGTQRVRELSIKSKEDNGLNKSIMHFSSPADIAGTGFLMIETADGSSDMWLYLPELNKSRKIVSSSKNDSFMGSDITYSDIEGKPLEDYQFSRYEDDVVDGDECYLIEAVPVNDSVAESTGYSRTIYAISKEKMIPLWGYIFDDKGSLLKQMHMQQVTNIDGTWIPSLIVVENIQSGHKTIMEMSNIKLNSDPDDSYFTQQYLKRGN